MPEENCVPETQGTVESDAWPLPDGLLRILRNRAPGFFVRQKGSASGCFPAPQSYLYRSETGKRFRRREKDIHDFCF